MFAVVMLNEKIPDLEGGKHEQLFHPSERVPFTWPGVDDVNAACGK